MNEDKKNFDKTGSREKVEQRNPLPNPCQSHYLIFRILMPQNPKISWNIDKCMKNDLHPIQVIKQAQVRVRFVWRQMSPLEFRVQGRLSGLVRLDISSNKCVVLQQDYICVFSDVVLQQDHICMAANQNDFCVCLV